MELKDGEIWCPKCKGSGKESRYSHFKTFPSSEPCSKCKGKGKLDWIENIVGCKSTLRGDNPCSEFSLTYMLEVEKWK